MASQVAVTGHSQLGAELQKYSGEKGKTIFILFSGSVDENGHSWCPDCVKADPVIEATIPEIPEDAVFMLCEVGQREYWKDPNNAFRTDPEFKLSSVPTLVKMENKDGKKHIVTRKLQEAECANADLVRMLLAED